MLQIKLKIANIYIDFYRFFLENECSYPYKIDAFSFDGSNKNVDITCRKELINKEELEKRMEIQLLYKEPNTFMQHKVYCEEDGKCLWVQNDSAGEHMLAYDIKDNWRIWTLIYDATNTNSIYAFEYCTKFFPYSVLELGGIVFHGVLMEYNGKGIIISAPSGTGKTTHARMWRDRERALIINGDRALCRKIDGKWTGFGMPWCGTSGEYINRSIQIDAIVVLERGKENTVEKLDTLQAFNHMIPNITAPTWEKNLLNKAMDYLEDIVNEVSVYKLKCTPDYEAVDVLKKEIDKL